MKFLITFVSLSTWSILYGQDLEIKGIWRTKSWVVNPTNRHQIEEYYLVKSEDEIGLNLPDDTTTQYSNWNFESDSTLISGTCCHGCLTGTSGSYKYTLNDNKLIIRSASDMIIRYEGVILKDSIVLKRKP